MEQFIKASIKKIKTAINNNKLVIFVGAGVSMNSNCPSWAQLIDKFADELGIPQENRENSMEYYLKIPQYYYIERGEKEYFDLVESGINSSDAMPNDIDRLIFKLNPSAVITTNFDDLLEKTIKDEGLFYTVVKQDRDLPYCFNDKLVIKMHGDGVLKNIILKEDDYLNYSSKFPLIENYIKGLFSTKTILFVGYSAEDQDFKLLFNLVKEQLGDDFQPAYLLEYGKELERINFNYYKNRGINILYYNEIKDEIEESIKLPGNSDLSNEFGQRLYKFLKYIACYEEKKDSLIDRIYDKLKIFEEMNAIMPTDIIRISNVPCSYDDFGNEELNFYEENKEIINICKEINTEKKEYITNEIFENKKLEKILNILMKAGIKCIRFSEENLISFESDLNFKAEVNKNNLKILDDNFEYKELYTEIKYYLDDKAIEGNEIKFIEKAYYLYHLEEYVEAYKILKKVATHSFARKKYIYYFISQFNMKQLKVCILNKDALYYKKIKEDVIDIERIYIELPKVYRDNLKFILQLDNFKIFYEMLYKIQENVNKLKNEKDIVERGGLAISYKLKNLYHDMRNIYNYINNNYIMVEHFSEIERMFSNFIEGIIVNYSIAEKNSLNVIKLDKLDSFIIIIIVKHLKSKTLKQYLRECKINSIEIEDKTKEYLISNLKKIFYNMDFKYIYKVINSINNIFILLSYIELTVEEFTEIIEIVIIALKKNNFHRSNFDELLNIVIKICNKNKETIDTKVLIKFIETYINDLYNKTLSIYSYDLISLERFFEQISYICLKIDNKTILSNEIELLGLIDSLNYNKKNDIKDDIINNLLIPIYSIMSSKCKEKFKIFISEYCNMQFKKNKYCYFELMYRLLNKNVFEYNIDKYKQFFTSAIEYIKKQLNIETNKDGEVERIIRSTGGPKSEDVVRICINIIREKNINYNEIKDIFSDVENEFPIFKFFINRENFDYDLFDMSWINYLSDDEFIKIITKEDKSGKILKLISKELEKEDINKKYKQKISKLIYHISDMKEENKSQ
ncbi:MAG: SIR2 family protein [Clostridiales bacterium]|nr:SIR2 family protein [Clostridiales bacterium]